MRNAFPHLIPNIQSFCATIIETPSLGCTVDVTRLCHVVEFRLPGDNRSCSTRIKAIHHEIVAVDRGNVRDSFLTFLFDLERNWRRNEGMGELPFCWANFHYFVHGVK